MRKPMAFSSAILCAGLPLVVWFAPGCSSSTSSVTGPENDPRFAAVTNDEYAEGASQGALTAPAASGSGAGPSTDGGPPPPPGPPPGPPPFPGGEDDGGGPIGPDGGSL